MTERRCVVGAHVGGGVVQPLDAFEMARKEGIDVVLSEGGLWPEAALFVGTESILVDGGVPKRLQQTAVARAMVARKLVEAGRPPEEVAIAHEAAAMLVRGPRFSDMAKRGASLSELYENQEFSYLTYELLVARYCDATGQVGTLWRHGQPYFRTTARGGRPGRVRKVEWELFDRAIRRRHGVIRGPGRARAQRVYEPRGPEVVTLIDPPVLKRR
jgi:hypothetical protein